MNGTGTKDGRGRNWACVVYTDSAPHNWLDILREAKIPLLISPLHDQDINPGGEAKKAHYHVMACYEGKKSYDQAKEFFDTFGGVGCEAVQSMRGYARYLCHLDNPEKAQYQIADVQAFGMDYGSTIDLPTDRYKAIREMMFFCKDNGVTSFAALLEYAAEDKYDWFRILCDNGTYVIKEYLKSITWASTHIDDSYADPDTGEIH